MAKAPPYLRLGDRKNYLTAEARQALLDSHEHLTEDALVPTPTQIFKAALELAKMVEQAKRPQAMKDAYSRALPLSRGGDLSADQFTHAFGYRGREVIHASISSYTNDGTQPDEQLEIGQLPPRYLVKGERIIMFDEVCDSGRSLDIASRIFTTGLGRAGLKSISDSSFQNAGSDYLRLKNDLINGLGAELIESAVIDYKPGKTKTGFEPDFWLHETEEWVIYPHEVSEQLGKKALTTILWTPVGEWA